MSDLDVRDLLQRGLPYNLSAPDLVPLAMRRARARRIRALATSVTGGVTATGLLALTATAFVLASPSAATAPTKGPDVAAAASTTPLPSVGVLLARLDAAARAAAHPTLTVGSERNAAPSILRSSGKGRLALTNFLVSSGSAVNGVAVSAWWFPKLAAEGRLGTLCHTPRGSVTAPISTGCTVEAVPGGWLVRERGDGFGQAVQMVRADGLMVEATVSREAYAQKGGGWSFIPGREAVDAKGQATIVVTAPSLLPTPAQLAALVTDPAVQAATTALRPYVR